MSVVIGIDLAAGRGTTEVAALGLTDESRAPIFDATAHQHVTSNEEIVAVVAATQPAVVAIDAPLSLPRAVMRGLESPHSTAADPATFPSDRVMVLPPPTSSAYTRAAERDPIWTALGLRPFPVSFLGGLTFRAISLLPYLRTAAPSALIIEVFPSATLRLLGITQPVARKRNTMPTAARKTSEESRRIAQRGLTTYVGGIPSPDEHLYSADVLDALAAALTAVAYLKGTYRFVGDVAEGGIVVPLGSRGL